MSSPEQTTLLELPDEILEDNLFSHLSFNDLWNLTNLGSRRLKRCANKVAEKKPFRNYHYTVYLQK